MGYQPVPASTHAIPLTFAGTVAVAVDEKRTNLMEFGRYVQEMLPKFVQHAQITHRYVHVRVLYSTCIDQGMTCTITIVHGMYSIYGLFPMHVKTLVKVQNFCGGSSYCGIF